MQGLEQYLEQSLKELHFNSPFALNLTPAAVTYFFKVDGNSNSKSFLANTALYL